METLNLKPLSFEESKTTNGGLVLEVLALVVGTAAGLLYAYEWGYNYAYKRTH